MEDAVGIRIITVGARSIDDDIGAKHKASSESFILFLTLFHSVSNDGEMQLRVEHMHCFISDSNNRGGSTMRMLKGTV